MPEETSPSEDNANNNSVISSESQDHPTSSERWAGTSQAATSAPTNQAATHSDVQQEHTEELISGHLDADVSDDVRKWKDSPWAVGFTKPTWREEPRSWCGADCCSPLCLTACFCPCAGRVGNMVVLSQTKDKLLCILGPYWMVLCFVTLPVLGALSVFVAYRTLSDMSVGIVIAWSICTGTMFTTLLLTGCRDPGILRRVQQIDDSASGTSSVSSSWRWNDQSLTYRPSSAIYDSECACVIAEFDHTCPWTGTAIGKSNMTTFKLFLASFCACVFFDVVLLVFL